MPRTLRSKLLLTFLATSILVLVANLFLFLRINYALSRIDRVYASNVEISETYTLLGEIQQNLTDYLDTKDSTVLSQYYDAENSYRSRLSGLDISEGDAAITYMIANIRALSDSYLDVAQETLQAKRGRNIQKYKAGFDQATEYYGYLNAYIESLNNAQFKKNTEMYSSLRQSFRSLERTSLLILVMVTLSNVAVTLGLTRTMTQPLRDLAEQANKISAGDFGVPDLHVGSHDEVGVVSAAFNKMAASIRGYIEQLRSSMELESQMKEKELRMDASLKEAELKYLQAQINPHFLFNTLNAGTQLAMMEEADTTYKYLQNVAAFFRHKTNREKQVTTLADEIALVDNYLYIINVRFQGEIGYDKSVDDDLTRVTIPSMVLQPIVENAINHGVRDISWPARISLSVYRMGDRIAISVRDNGKGMTPEQVEDLMTAIAENRSLERARGDETNGVGLANVINRLKLFYDLETEDVFDITSAGEGKGTEVLLFLPMPT